VGSVIPARMRDRLLDRWQPIAPSVRRIAPRRDTLKDDALSGLTGAIGSVPDGMASGVLAGVNPVFGLYASLFGPLIGGLFSSSQLLVVTTTSAAALAAGQSLGGLSGDDRSQGLFLLVLIIGATQVAAGLLRLGRLTRFVSHSVMIGFLTGIAVLIILGQLGDFTGYSPEGSNKVAQTFDLIRHAGSIDLQSLVAGCIAIALAAVLSRTRLGAFGALFALVVPSVLVGLLGWDGVSIVKDSGDIPRGIPTPDLPTLSVATLDLVTGGLAIAAIILVQGAGVSQGVPNPDGSPSNISRDFIAQGAANVASGFFQGMPVGGSVGQTALGVSAGARTRWGPIFSGLWMAVILLIFAGLVGQVVMPALAGLLILAGISAINTGEAVSIWHTGWPARIAIVTTFVATLFTPIQIAVGIGVALSAVLYLYRLSSDVRIFELVDRDDGAVIEREPPAVLPSHQVTALNIYGSLFYAGARTLEDTLPSPRGAVAPAVVLRLRGETSVGSTLVDVLAHYSEQLDAVGGRLYLTGVDERVHRQFTRTGKVGFTGPVSVYLATDVIGESTRQALADADAWLVTTSEPGGGDGQPVPQLSTPELREPNEPPGRE
jgi:sulfate permease, SulP family